MTFRVIRYRLEDDGPPPAPGGVLATLNRRTMKPTGTAYLIHRVEQTGVRKFRLVVERWTSDFKAQRVWWMVWDKSTRGLSS